MSPAPHLEYSKASIRFIQPVQAASQHNKTCLLQDVTEVVGFGRYVGGKVGNETERRLWPIGNVIEIIPADDATRAVAP